MNPLMLYRSLPYIIIVLLAIALAWMTNLYHSERDKRVALTASVAALGEAAKVRVEEVKKQSEAALKTVKENHEKLAPAIRAAAVDNYRRAHPGLGRVCKSSPGGGPVPGDAPGEQVADGTLEEPLLDSALIEEAASDANKLTAWQEWARINHIPTKD